MILTTLVSPSHQTRRDCHNSLSIRELQLGIYKLLYEVRRCDTYITLVHANLPGSTQLLKMKTISRLFGEQLKRERWKAHFQRQIAFLFNSCIIFILVSFEYNLYSLLRRELFLLSWFHALVGKRSLIHTNVLNLAEVSKFPQPPVILLCLCPPLFLYALQLSFLIISLNRQARHTMGRDLQLQFFRSK